MTAPIRGVVPPFTVPHKDEKLDTVSLKRHINRMIDAGIHALFVLGSSDEVVFSTPQRRGEILEATQSIVEGCVRVIAGVIDTETDRVIEHIRQAKSFGVDVVVATVPFYAPQGEVEIYWHFRTLREITDLPLWAYDISVCVHTKLSNRLLIDLSTQGVLSGVKDSSGDDMAFRWLAYANGEAGHPLQLLTGHEVVVDGVYMSGADGAVPGLDNIDLYVYVRMWDAFQAGDWERARQEQDRFIDLMRIVQVSGVQGFGAGIGAFKTALKLLGVLDTNDMPTPVKSLEGENVAWVESVLRQTGMPD